MSAGGNTTTCKACGAMVRIATRASDGSSVEIEPVSRSVLVAPNRSEPYRNVQQADALIEHAKVCRGGKG